MSLTIHCLYLYFGMGAGIFATKNSRVKSIREYREYYWLQKFPTLGYYAQGRINE